MIVEHSSLLASAEARLLCERILTMSHADQTEVLLIGTANQLTRFARNQIHQNVAERNLEIRIRTVFGTQVGVATTNDTSEEALQRTVERACDIAMTGPENPDFNGLPSPDISAIVQNSLSERVIQCQAAERARA
ncbi:MAG: hypothetical protein HY692_06210, partial [Cyanobacteria bacterium NC_groundwater_1444_Ag_S-0.65um_54_12]|nr:hypothetical protein [Cyanobacteria bacterium NC_groundwater_1444_Ag_S-0.65um_54_12]